jgi:hypothetical protein
MHRLVRGPVNVLSCFCKILVVNWLFDVFTFVSNFQDITQDCIVRHFSNLSGLRMVSYDFVQPKFVLAIMTYLEGAGLLSMSSQFYMNDVV